MMRTQIIVLLSPSPLWGRAFERREAAVRVRGGGRSVDTTRPPPEIREGEFRPPHKGEVQKKRTRCRHRGMA